MINARVIQKIERHSSLAIDEQLLKAVNL